MTRFAARFREEEEPQWRFDKSFTWPQVRGQRVLDELLTSSTRCATKAGEIVVDQVQVSAGHVALVLTTRQQPDHALRERITSPSKSKEPTAPVAAATAAAAASSSSNAPYVVFVVDAVPPSLSPPPASATPPGSANRRRLTCSSSTSCSHSGKDDHKHRRFSVSPFASEPDDLELIIELFNAPKTGKDNCLLAKPPLLCVRHDFRVVGVRFTRNTSRVAPLRCVVAREDGFAHIWQWHAEAFAWHFCNRLSFLANPNLAWTKPVVFFESVALESSDDMLEFAWWSTESKDQPTLCFRKLRFEKACSDNSTSSHGRASATPSLAPNSSGQGARYSLEPATTANVRPSATSTSTSSSSSSSSSGSAWTEIVVGNTFSVHCNQVTQLFCSPRGFWIVCTDGIFLRSSRTYQTLHTTWSAHLRGDRQRRFCVHNVTGELLVLLGNQGEVVSFAEEDTTLVAKRVRFLHNWQRATATLMQGMVAHRHCLLVLLDGECLVYSLLSGHLLHAIDLPRDRRNGKHVHATTPFRFWQVNGIASSVGLWSDKGFWWLRTPSAKKLAFEHDDRFQNASAAFQCMKDFGASARFEMAFFALEVLEQTRLTMEFCHLPAWKAAVETISSPALLLAALGETKSPDQLIKYIEDIVFMMHRIATDVTVTGRFTLNMEKNPYEEDGKYAQHLTPANIESFARLSNWVLLAKRKLARLKASHQLERHEKRTRTRTVSTLHTEAFAENTSFGSASDLLTMTTGPNNKNNSKGCNTSQQLAAVTSPYSFSRKLAHMSCLRFAACCCSLAHGSKWLSQLQTFLLDGVSLSTATGTGCSSPVACVQAPSHLLFHEERGLVDFHVATSTFSKHMYFELLARLYLFNEPTLLPSFVACVTKFCPRFFSLVGNVQFTRTHAERVLLLLPSPHLFVTKWHMEQAEIDVENHDPPALTKQVIEAYVELFCVCGFFQEACRLLLDCGFVDECKQLLQRAALSEACAQAIYFQLIEFCVVQQRAVDELCSVVRLKPNHVNALQVFHALREYLARPVSTTSSTRESHLTVGALRPVLMWLLKCRSMRSG